MNSSLVQAEIDLKAIDHNIRELRRVTSPKAGLMAVVKANAYGHGAVEVAKQAIKSGADALGVARIDEGIELRKANIAAPILIFGYTTPEAAAELLEYDLIPTVFSYENAKALSEAAEKRKSKIGIHLKVDSGMGRLGFLPDCLGAVDMSAAGKKAAIRQIESIAGLPGLEIQGIFSHFAISDSADKTSAKRQFEIFTEFLDGLRQVGLDFPLKHAANSAATIDMPETHLDMVRTGIAIYGLKPSEEVDFSRIDLEPAMTIKTKIVHLKEVPAGFKVSYGSTYVTEKPTAIATVPIGYGDGYNRLLSSRGCMLIGGRRAPIVGRVCMDLTMLDVGHIPGATLEDEVIVLGRQETESITADEIAASLNTINYEIVTAITARVPRIYL
ncbi:MAG: alanine racemase [Proteobacteria bacterium]|nr:alanine racemase [Pseudomonadota bacterium]